ncbi:UPF0182 family protein [Yinghuangia seranimata]|uniref:UPF0182 family membrane protein n=1 Tax=Yinghuangia seranimata TaxID=408067 RepID=UPI00248B1BD2|nr:UPF0182 family protein [Yinghuangia seranimata]MDI2128036.1 UPF0182 family protein [Yinghuangia seranimata]
MPERGDPRGRRIRLGAPSRRLRTLLLTLGIIAVLVVAWILFANFWTDWLWYKSVGYGNVFTTKLWTRLGLFLVFGVLMAAAVGLNMYFAYRLRPQFRGMSLEQQSLDRYRSALAPFRVWILAGLSVIVGIIAGTSAAGHWSTWLLFVNGVSFGVKDPQFHKDVSFFAFDLPFYRFLVDFAFIAVVVGLIVAVLTHYLYGGLRVQSPGARATPAAQAHLSLLLGLFVLLKAIAYWLDRYALAVHSGDFKEATQFTGLRYTDANAVLPAKTILFIVALICAVLFFVNVFRRTWALPIIGFGLMVLSAVLIGGLYPFIVERFQVKPNQQAKEAKYIEYNIKATRDAYGIADVNAEGYAGSTDTKAGLVDEARGAASIRLLDPNVVGPTFQQLQQLKQFYGFNTTLDVDRYVLDGKVQDTVIALRELNPNGLQNRNWVNDHTKYTHGYGVVAADGNQVDVYGNPEFIVSNITPDGTPSNLGTYQQRIYFGEKTTEYSIVGAPQGTAPTEIDYPDERLPGGQATYTYTGNGGVPIGSTFNKLLYATKFADGNILLSSSINEKSRILYNRTPKERVEAVAPWLTIDGDAYPAVIDGKIQWIVDAYTTTNGYPYSSRTTLGDTTADSAVRADQKRGTVGNTGNVNYIRNSVKATVDAYTGAVTLYQWDEQDPVLKTWMKAFPGTVEKKDKISPALMQHLRYPQDLFKVQREMLTRYHVTNPQTFFNGSDFWKVPQDPTTIKQAGGEQPPYYLSMKMPPAQGQAPETDQVFRLTSALVPNQRQSMAAFLAVNAQPGPDYGKFRLLSLPSTTTINGPEQMQNVFTSNPTVSTSLGTIGGLNASQVVYGNLLSLPVGGGMLYVEPVYVKAVAQNNSSYPLMKKVLASYGNTIAYEDTLEKAFAVLFAGAQGAVPNPGSPPPAGGTNTTPPPTGGATTPPSTTPPPAGGQQNPTVKQALDDAQKAIADADAALKAGDFAKYGDAQKRLNEAITRAVQAETAATAPAAPPASPTPGQTQQPALPPASGATPKP